MVYKYINIYMYYICVYDHGYLVGNSWGNKTKLNKPNFKINTSLLPTVKPSLYILPKLEKMIAKVFMMKSDRE